MNHVEYRFALLEVLYDQALESGDMFVNFTNEVQSMLPDVPENILQFNLHYLESRGLLDVGWCIDNEIDGITLTSEACDYVEFLRCGLSMDSTDNESKFVSIIKQIGKSGVNVLEGSALGIVNVAIAKLLG